MSHYSDNLEFAIDKSISTNHGYGTKQILERKDYGDYICHLNNTVLNGATSDLRHHITSRISGGIFGSSLGSRHILMLDCDSKPDMMTACSDLHSRGIQYCVVLSSYYDTEASERYWILADYIRSIKEVLNVAENISGMDAKYTHFCKEKELFNLRAYPRKYSMPIFKHECTGAGEELSEEFQKWMTSFKAYWWGDDIKAVVRSMIKNNRYPDYIPENVGKHFDLNTYETIQYFINEEYEKEVVFQSKIESTMRSSRNAVYGLEVEA